MKYYRGMPVGLWLVAISTIIFIIYYHIRPFLWGAYISIYAPMFTLTLWGFFIWFNIILEVIEIYAVTYGFYNAKNWARLFTIAVTLFSSFWTVYFLFVERVWPYERYIWLWYYVIILVYLFMSDVRDYFVIGKK
jgi:hypothetical protein